MALTEDGAAAAAAQLTAAIVQAQIAASGLGGLREDGAVAHVTDIYVHALQTIYSAERLRQGTAPKKGSVEIF